MEMSLGFVHINDDGSIGTDGDAIVHTSTDTTNVVTSIADTTSITPTADGGNVAGADDEEGSNTLTALDTFSFRKRSPHILMASSQSSSLGKYFETFRDLISVTTRISKGCCSNPTCGSSHDWNQDV